MTTTIGLTQAQRRLAKRLLSVQCWLWGRDIRHTPGNLLLEYGFTRQRPANPSAGSSVYTLQVAADLRVVLWGFGMFVGADSGLFLQRFDFVPVPCCGWPPDTPPASLDAMRALTLGAPPPHPAQQWDWLTRGLRWVATYEAWAQQQVGLMQRQEWIVACPGRPWRRDAALVPLEWLTLTEQLARAS